jgi:hypothetical protein
MADDSTFFFKLVMFLVIVGTFVSLLNMGSTNPLSSFGDANVSINTTAPSTPTACTYGDWISTFWCFLYSMVNLLFWVIAMIIAFAFTVANMILFFTGLTGFVTGHTAFPFPLSLIIPAFLVFGWLYAAGLIAKRIREMFW